MHHTETINAAMGARRLTNKQVSKLAGVATKVVSDVRNGTGNPRLSSLKSVAGAIGLRLEIKFVPESWDSNDKQRTA